jgi:hypothetical protein
MSSVLILFHTVTSVTNWPETGQPEADSTVSFVPVYFCQRVYRAATSGTDFMGVSTIWSFEAAAMEWFSDFETMLWKHRVEQR